jgi:type II secretion system protein D
MNSPILSRPALVCLVGLSLGISATLLAQASSDSTLRAYPIRNLRAEQIEAQVIRALGELPERPKVAVDSRSNQILVRGSQRAHQLAEHVIDSIDRAASSAVGDGRTGNSVLRSYPIRGQDLGARLARLRAQYANTPGVRLAADHRSGAILVEAPVELHGQIARQIGDSPTAWKSRPVSAPAARPLVRNPGPTIRRDVQLRNASWKSIYASLQGLLQRPIPAAQQRGGRTVAYWLTTGDAPGVEMHVDAQTGQIAIHGPADQAVAWSRVIEALDGPAAPGNKRTEVVALHRSDPQQVRYAVTAFSTANQPAVSRTASVQLNRPGLRLLAALLQDNGAAKQAGPQAKPDPNDPVDPKIDPKIDPKTPPARKQLGEITGGGLIGPVQVEFLEGTDILIIRGHPKDVERVLKIIKDIEDRSVETKPMIRVKPLRFVDSESMEEMVSSLYQQALSSRLGSVSITALVKPNALLLIGREESVTAVVELIDRLDTPVPASSQFRVFRLRYAAAFDAQLMIQQFYGDRVSSPQYVRTALGAKLLVTADQRSNALIVRGAPRDLDEVAELIRQIDTPSSEAINQLRVFRLQNSLAEELAPVLQAAIVGQTGQQQTGAGGAQQRPPGQQGGAAQRTGTKSSMLQLLTVDPDGQRVLKSGILSDVRVTADTRGNTLLVSAPAESMELLAALIEQLDHMPAAEAQVKVFTIINSDASSLADMLDGLFGQQQGQGQISLPSATGSGESTLIGLRFSVDPRTNSIVATGAAADLNVVEAILLRLDESDVRQRKSVVYRLQHSPAIDVANAVNEFLSSEREIQAGQPDILSPFEQIEREVVVVPEPVSNSLIVSATPRYFDEVTKLVEQLDKRPPMVMIQVLIAEVTLSDVDEFGLELGVQDDVLFRRGAVSDLVTTTSTTSTSTVNGIVTTTEDTILSGARTPGFNFNNQPLGNSFSDASNADKASHIAAQALSTFAVGRINDELGFGGLVLSASSEAVSVLFRALQQNRRTEILARPQIMTLDNQPAFIQVGQRVPRITASNISDTGTVNTTVLENVGLLLGVTPRISPDGLVVMEIDAEKSEVGPEVEGIPISISATGDVIRSPRINVTTAQTTVSAMSGQTIILGGLITKAYSETERRVPLLSDIPLIGNAFRFSNVTETRTELLIIMTPYIVRDEKDAEWIKQVESARMSWVMSDVMEIHGDIGVRGRTDDWHDDETDTVYPDHENGEVIMPPMPEDMPRAPKPVPMSKSASRSRRGIAPAALEPVQESRFDSPRDGMKSIVRFPERQSAAYMPDNPYRAVRPAAYDGHRDGRRYDGLPGGRSDRPRQAGSLSYDGRPGERDSRQAKSRSYEPNRFELQPRRDERFHRLPSTRR